MPVCCLHIVAQPTSIAALISQLSVVRSSTYVRPRITPNRHHIDEVGYPPSATRLRPVALLTCVCLRFAGQIIRIGLQNWTMTYCLLNSLQYLSQQHLSITEPNPAVLYNLQAHPHPLKGIPDSETLGVPFCSVTSVVCLHRCGARVSTR